MVTPPETSPENPSAVTPLSQFSHGQPPAVVRATLDRLHAVGTASAAPRSPELLSRVPAACPAPPEIRPHAAAATPVPRWVERLLPLVEYPQVAVGIRINKVRINLKTVAVSREGTCFCLLVTGDPHCELPLSNDVELTIDGVTHQVFYFGQWFIFACLPFQVLCFVAPEGEQSASDAALLATP